MSSNLFKECIDLLSKNPNQSVITVGENKHKLGTINNKAYRPTSYSFGQRSQDLEPLFYENGLLYITKANAILKDKIITENAFPFVVNHIFATVDIDTQHDFDYATFIVNRHLEKQ